VEKKKDHNQPSSSSNPHGENACSNGWHNVRNHQWSQRRWGSTHRPHHIIVVCYCNRCTNDGLGNLVDQMKDRHETMLEHENIYKKRVHEYKKTTQNCLYLSLILIFHYQNVHDIIIVSNNRLFTC
jgi:hypothetical protein